MRYKVIMLKEGDNFVGVVPDLNVSSFGKTLTQAFNNTREAVELYCEDLKVLPFASSEDELKSRTDGTCDNMIKMLEITIPEG